MNIKKTNSQLGMCNSFKSILTFVLVCLFISLSQQNNFYYRAPYWQFSSSLSTSSPSDGVKTISVPIVSKSEVYYEHFAIVVRCFPVLCRFKKVKHLQTRKFKRGKKYEKRMFFDFTFIRWFGFQCLKEREWNKKKLTLSASSSHKLEQ